MQNISLMLWFSLGFNVLLLGGLIYQRREFLRSDRHELSRAVYHAENKAGESAAQLSKKLGNAKEKVQETAANAKENVKGAAQGAKERVKDAYSDLTEKR